MSAVTRPRKCSQEKDTAYLAHKSKRICIPIEPDEYQRIMPDPQEFRQYLDDLIAQYPELFPATIPQGYQLHDILPASQKMPEVRMRRIKVKTSAGDKKQVFTIAPSFVLPYMTGYTTEVEHALFLRKFGVPYWALTRVFGRDDNYWERIEQRWGQNSVVGTTVKKAAHLPADVLGDEKHTRLNGEKVYVATTVGADCVLGASVTLQADADSLTEGYRHFQTEAQDLAPDYAPQTVNTDGWAATQLAWQRLFPQITVILCFLHAFLKIRDRCKRMKEHFPEICQRVWDGYHADDQQTFMARIQDLETWASAHLPPGSGLDAVLKLCAQAAQFARTYDHPSAHRTSNMLDRHMDRMDRCFYSAQYFHGHLMTAEYKVRAWALLHNFQPYCPRTPAAAKYSCPAHKLNGFVYHHNWLQNLLVSSSMGGFRQ